MEIFPYAGIGDLKFTDSPAAIKKKLSKFETIEEVNKVELDKEYPSIYIQDIDLYIVFREDGSGVRYFELESDVYHLEVNLHTTPLKKLIDVYKKADKDFKKLDDGFDSAMYGIRVTKGEEKGNAVLVYSKEYSSEKEISEDDIINYFLKQ